MGNTKWLGRVAERHQEWIEIINSFGEFDLAEDFVQEMYLTLEKYASEEKIIQKGSVSRGYVFFTLRSLYFQYYNAKKKINKVRIDDENNYEQIPYNSEMDEEIGYSEFCSLIDNHIENWGWYDKTSETKISWVSIFKTLKKSKDELKELFKEDYEDFKNKDYERNRQKN